MSPQVEGAGVLLAYEERGAGDPVLLIHGMASDARALRPAARELEPVARVIAHDRRGYGASGSPEPYTGTTVMEQAEDAVAVLTRLGAARAVVAGDGFGALVALDLAHRHPGLVRGVVAADPPLLALVPEATEALGTRRQEVHEALRDRGPQAGVAAWLGGRVAGEALERARVAHRGFYADFAGLASWPVTRPELRRIALPVVVLTAPGAPPAIVLAADRLAALLLDVRRADDGDLAAAVRSLL